LQPSKGTEGRWRVVCVPEAHPAAIELARQQALAGELTSESARPALMLWRCQPALLVTRQETRLPHFREVSDQMFAANWPILARKSGGRACPIGLGTVQVSMIETAISGATMNAKYDALTKLIQSTLCFFGIVSRTESVTGAYCAGSYDLAVNGKKIAGMSQHWFRNQRGVHCIVTAASINIEEAPDVLASAINRFYCNVGSSARCQSTALTNMRLCDGNAHLVVRNLASAVMNQLASSADVRGGTTRERNSARAALSTS